MHTAAGVLGAVRRVPLDASGRRWALVHELCGVDEQSVGGRSSLDAVRLLDRLLVEGPGTAVEPGSAGSLTIPERDLLLAAVWQMSWSDGIDGTLTCSACDEPFDFAFDLDDVAEQVRSATAGLPCDHGTYTTTDGLRFRLPTADDERAVFGLTEGAAEEELLRRCIVTGALDGDVDSDSGAPAGDIEAAMESVGSGIDVDVDVRCPECAAVQVVRFQIQDYLLGAITSDWRGLVDDVHRIALAFAGAWARSCRCRGDRAVQCDPRRRSRPRAEGVVSDYLRRVVARTAPRPVPATLQPAAPCCWGGTDPFGVEPPMTAPSSEGGTPHVTMPDRGAGPGAARANRAWDHRTEADADVQVPIAARSVRRLAAGADRSDVDERRRAGFRPAAGDRAGRTAPITVSGAAFPPGGSR